MPQLHLYGAGDDLIEIAGDLDEEFNPNLDSRNRTWVAVSDGTLVRFELAGEGWEARVVTADPHTTVQVIQARGDGEPDDEYGCPGYSDRVTIDSDAPFLWVALATAYVDKDGLHP